jgi:hypothetical protein
VRARRAGKEIAMSYWRSGKTKYPRPTPCVRVDVRGETSPCRSGSTPRRHVGEAFLPPTPNHLDATPDGLTGQKMGRDGRPDKIDTLS